MNTNLAQQIFTVISRKDLRLKLRDIYAKLPKLNCKGLCQDSCGPINCTEEEAALLLDQVHKARFPSDPTTCPFLGPKSGTCQVYEDRPLICRTWGLDPRMKCHYGCEPEGWINAAYFQQLIQEIQEVIPEGVSFLSDEAMYVMPITQVVFWEMLRRKIMSDPALDDCATCGGEGFIVTHKENAPDGQSGEWHATCDDCNGCGKDLGNADV